MSAVPVDDILSQATSEHDFTDTYSIDSFASSPENSGLADQQDSVSNKSASASSTTAAQDYSSQASHYMAVVLYDYQVTEPY